MGYSRVLKYGVLEYGILEGTRCSALYETASSVYPEAVFVPFEEWPDVVGAIQAGTCRARTLPSPTYPLALARRPGRRRTRSPRCDSVRSAH